ncbi:diguanylate cyclase [Microvirga sp. TS319]|uniref:GGDEF domain-containing protein n=1 Tax=Microvirga sp. TS319 TaxID=3241165 RepID=UPI00351AA0A7
MVDTTRTFSLPKWRFTRWLADPGKDVPTAIRHALISNLFGTLPIFIGGVANTILVSAVIALRKPEPLFLAWFGLEVLLGIVRTWVILIAYRGAARQQETPTDLYLLLALAWAFGVGAGAFISLLSGDWVVAALACLSAAAMMGGICFRNFAAQRLATAMIVLSFGPACLGALLSGEPIMLLSGLQIPFYLYAMSKAVYRLNGMLVSTMRAERDNDHWARHDMLTGLANRRSLVELNESAAEQAVVLVLMDIDHFKAVNDTYGHQVGDSVLQAVGKIIAGHLTPYGAVGRFGGEEFALIASTGSVDELLPALGELLAIMEKTPIVAAKATVRLTLSVGVAVRGAFEPFDPAYAAADEALYRAKRAGRNRIQVAERVKVAG